MRPFLVTSGSAALALFLAALAIVLPNPVEGPWTPGIGRFWLVVALGFPFAIYSAMIMEEYVSSRVAERSGGQGLALEAHVLGLGLAGGALILLLLGLLVSGFDAAFLWTLFPRAFTATVAGGSGLAWGSLGMTPKEQAL
jgi:hypothetical protein